MKKNKISVTDKLRDRGFIDQWGFLTFAILGSISIILSKWMGYRGDIVAVGAVAAMLLYALVIYKAGSGRLRADQAGDNSYYLGLIYTLASLSYAIATFDPSNTASTIVQGFGVALATTILGLVLRVFFNLGRPDLESFEEDARLEFTQAVSRLKSELNDAVRQMNDFSRQLQQSIQETHEVSQNSISALATSITRELETVVSIASDSIRSESLNFSKRSSKFTSTFEELLARLEDHSLTLQKIGTSQAAVAEAATLAKETSESALITIQSLSEGATSASVAANSAQSASTSALRTIEELQSFTYQFEKNFEILREETKKQILELKQGPTEAIGTILATLTEASITFQEHLQKVVSIHQEAEVSLSSQAKRAIDTSVKHNQELEAELGRSRELVLRVHKALTEMTESLAETVEG